MCWMRSLRLSSSDVILPSSCSTFCMSSWSQWFSIVHTHEHTHTHRHTHTHTDTHHTTHAHTHTHTHTPHTHTHTHTHINICTLNDPKWLLNKIDPLMDT